MKGSTAVALCQFCHLVPTQPDQHYCCEGCATLAGLVNHGPLARVPEDRRLLATFGERTPRGIQFRCAVEPLACEACLVGLSRLEKIFPFILDISWDRRDSILSFELVPEEASPTAVFGFLQDLGMKPRWLKPLEGLEQGNQQRAQILRLALTGAFAGNIMMFAIPIYAGLTGTLATVFEWIQLAIFLPVLFYSAKPVFQTAWSSLRLRQLSVDLPLAVAFLMGSIFSIVQLLQGGHDLYFDSLSGFIFLILLSRFILDRALYRFAESPDIGHFFNQPLYRLRRAGEELYETWDQIRPGDELELERGSRLPVDGILLSEAAEFENSWMTGEIFPILRLRNSEVEAGVSLLSKEARIRVLRTADKTLFARLVREVQRTREKLKVGSEARLGVALVVACFVASGFLFAFHSTLGFAEAFRRSLALFIVACPCAVSFAAPLARARAARLASKLGFLVRKAEAWSSLVEVKSVAFDKTGTLTGGYFSIAPNSPLLDDRWKRIILSLENISRHPVAESLRRAWGVPPLLPVESAHEIPGVGVEGIIEGEHYLLRTGSEDEVYLRLELLRRGHVVAEIVLEDSMKPGTRESLRTLAKHYKIYIISGDSQVRVDRFAQWLRLPAASVFGGLKPEEKRAKIAQIQPELYFGDGTNDLLALREAPVAVAVGPASLEAQSVSHIIMHAPDLLHLPRLFLLAREVRSLIGRNFQLAATYNIVAGGMAVTGHMGPLLAAVLMPIASLILTASTLWGTSAMRSMEKEQ